jgi:phosphopantothenoylcysteine decarboxylase/phosphopantothenate--cysteine ligase
MASGLVGPGRLLETPELIGHIRLVLGQDGSLAGKHVLVTAGPTQEPFDPVRYLTNRSSGKQGIALAQAALDLGARVTVIAGELAEPIPLGAKHVPVRTALEMHDAVLGRLASADILLKVAAVADFRPATYSNQKIKKTKISADAPSIQLARNLDIMAAVKTWRDATGHKLVVLGFAAETENVLDNGRDKMVRKGMDFIAINDVSAADAGFQATTNRVVLLGPDGLFVEIPLQSKAEVAEQILAHVAAYLAVPRTD